FLVTPYAREVFGTVVPESCSGIRRQAQHSLRPLNHVVSITVPATLADPDTATQLISELSLQVWVRYGVFWHGVWVFTALQAFRPSQSPKTILIAYRALLLNGRIDDQSSRAYHHVAPSPAAFFDRPAPNVDARIRQAFALPHGPFHTAIRAKTRCTELNAGY